MKEVWKAVPVNNKYEASNLGQVRNKDTKHVLTPHDDGNGYMQVSLFFDGNIKKTIKVHRIIGETFIGPLPDSLETAHSNNVKTDCRAVNLSYQTKSVNQKMAYACGLKPTYGTRKLIEADVIEMKKLIKLGWNNIELSKMFKVSKNMCSMIRTGVRWPSVSC